MRTKLLRRLRNKHQIRSQTVHVIKTMYSVTPLHKCVGCNEFEVPFATYSYKEAVKRQRELILDKVNALRNKK